MAGTGRSQAMFNVKRHLKRGIPESPIPANGSSSDSFQVSQYGVGGDHSRTKDIYQVYVCILSQTCLRTSWSPGHFTRIRQFWGSPLGDKNPTRLFTMSHVTVVARHLLTNSKLRAGGLKCSQEFPIRMFPLRALPGQKACDNYHEI